MPGYAVTAAATLLIRECDKPLHVATPQLDADGQDARIIVTWPNCRRALAAHVCPETQLWDAATGRPRSSRCPGDYSLP